MKKSILILSGGLDSVTLLHYIAKYRKEEVYPVAFIDKEPRKLPHL